MIRSSAVFGIFAAIIVSGYFLQEGVNTHVMTGTIPEPIVHPFLSLAAAIIASLIVVCIIFSEGNHEK